MLYKALSNVDILYMNTTYSCYSYFGPSFISLNFINAVSFLSFVLGILPFYPILFPDFEWLVDFLYSGFNLFISLTWYGFSWILHLKWCPHYIIFVLLFEVALLPEHNLNINPCSPILLPSIRQTWWLPMRCSLLCPCCIDVNYVCSQLYISCIYYCHT